MKTKFVLVLAFVALIAKADVKAGVVSVASIGKLAEDGRSYSNTFNFTISNPSNVKLNSIALLAKDSGVLLSYFTITLKNSGGSTIGSPITATNYNANTSGSNTVDLTNLGALAASTAYKITLDIKFAGAVSGGLGLNSAPYGTQTGTEFQNLYNSGNSPIQYESGPNFSFNMDVSSVPEPGTLILTGSALVAGAVGAYLKRRRKTQQQEAA